MASLEYLTILVAYFLFTLFLLRVAFSGSQFPVRLLMISLLVAQFCIKLIDRFYLPAYLSRVDDEGIWLSSLVLYKSSGKLPYHATLEGPGIYYIVNMVASLFHVDYATALIGLAIVLGSLYLIPTFIMYRMFFEGDVRLAFVSTLLLSMADVMVSSTTVARPTLFGLFLMPITVSAFQALRGRFRMSTFIVLVFSSMAILLMHAPITFVVLLSLVSFTILIFDKVRKWEAAYTVILFSSYALTLLFLPFLENGWKTTFFGLSPFNLITSLLGDTFFLIFPIIGFVVLLLSSPLHKVIIRIRDETNVHLPSYTTLGLVSLACLTFSILVLSKYALFITTYYGGMSSFSLLQAWKILFIIVGLVGLKTIATQYRRTSNDTSLPWLLSIAFVVVLLMIFAPMTRNPGVINLDERFTEFAYFPAIYFVTVGLNCLAGRLSTRTFRWIILPSIASYVIPSIIVGTRMLSIFRT